MFYAQSTAKGSGATGRVAGCYVTDNQTPWPQAGTGEDNDSHRQNWDECAAGAIAKEKSLEGSYQGGTKNVFLQQVTFFIHCIQYTYHR